MAPTASTGTGIAASNGAAIASTIGGASTLMSSNARSSSKSVYVTFTTGSPGWNLTLTFIGSPGLTTAPFPGSET